MQACHVHVGTFRGSHCSDNTPPPLILTQTPRASVPSHKFHERPFPTQAIVLTPTPVVCHYFPQIEADIRPFKGLLLGLFFVSVGASVDTEVLIRNWKEVFWILAGLLVVKVSVITGGS